MTRFEFDLNFEVDPRLNLFGGHVTARSNVIINQANYKSVTLNFRVFKGANEVNYTDYVNAEIIFLKPDGTNVVGDTGTGDVLLTPTGVTVLLHEQVVKAAGKVQGQLSMYTASGIETPLIFSFNVEKNLLRLFGENSRNFFGTVIDDLIRELEEAIKNGGFVVGEVTSESVPYDTEPSVYIDVIDGKINFHFNLQQGVPGDLGTGGGESSADKISFDDTFSKLGAEDVQRAIDILAARKISDDYNKGFFYSVEELKIKYPNPINGDFAIVLQGGTGLVYGDDYTFEPDAINPKIFYIQFIDTQSVNAFFIPEIEFSNGELVRASMDSLRFKAMNELKNKMMNEMASGTIETTVLTNLTITETPLRVIALDGLVAGNINFEADVYYDEINNRIVWDMDMGMGNNWTFADFQLPNGEIICDTIAISETGNKPVFYAAYNERWYNTSGGGGGGVDGKDGRDGIDGKDGRDGIDADYSKFAGSQPDFYEDNVTVATLSANLATTATLGAGWSGTFPTFTHASGNTEVLAFPVTIVNGNFYEIVFTRTGTTATYNFNLIFGASTTATTGQTIKGNIYYNTTFVVRAIADYSHLNVVPSSAWAGNFTLTSIKEFTSLNSESLSIKGVMSIVKGNNISYGNGGKFLTTGSNNTISGMYAAYSITAGSNNTISGNSAAYYFTTGGNNTISGASAAYSLTAGNNNTISGAYAAYSITTGGYNVISGDYAARFLTAGDYNVISGNYAARYLSNNTTTQTIANDSVFIGASTKGYSEDDQTNQIVIGYDATGGGSNTITLGNFNVTKLRCQVTAITALSDARVKEDIELADKQMCYDTVKNLPVSRYKYKDFTGKHEDKHVTGFMADDVEKVFPKSVSLSDQYFPVLDENGEKTYEDIEETTINEDGTITTSTRTVEKMFLLKDVKDITMTDDIPTLWGAVQELMARVEKLERKEL